MSYISSSVSLQFTECDKRRPERTLPCGDHIRPKVTWCKKRKAPGHSEESKSDFKIKLYPENVPVVPSVFKNQDSDRGLHRLIHLPLDVDEAKSNESAWSIFGEASYQPSYAVCQPVGFPACLFPFEEFPIVLCTIICILFLGSADAFWFSVPWCPSHGDPTVPVTCTPIGRRLSQRVNVQTPLPEKSTS
ncbi:hypothetical protein MJG53_011406 [Ovis ammon polii x Ovis aries]|uniref:Uncharacterized protein n=1 Tax=Ovis ammon polii x Ovis aries TaxID=2918886 RepID=A0ACB9UTB9_9CETA|nr:hypothetical protein MJG53_011406 [Ovis ammon polii x Ovis aries]